MGYLEDTCKVFTDGVGKCELQEFEGVAFGDSIFVSWI